MRSELSVNLACAAGCGLASLPLLLSLPALLSTKGGELSSCCDFRFCGDRGVRGALY